MVASINSSSVSNWADSVFSKLDTKNQGYIEKADLASALGATGEDGADQSVDLDDTFSALDGDSDGKITKSELTDAMTKLSDQLNAQFDASRVAGEMQGGQPPGPPPDSADSADGSSDSGTLALGSVGGGAGGPRGAGGPPPGGGVGGAGGSGSTEETDETSSSSTTYVAAADTDGDGTVSDTEQAAYDKKVASGEADSGSSSSGGTEKAGGKPPRDPIRELAHAMNLLKAYAENGGSESSAASTGSTASSVSVEA